MTKNRPISDLNMSNEQYPKLTDHVELKLDEADKAAALSDARYTADEVFKRVRERAHG